jgi:hypothetical protein
MGAQPQGITERVVSLEDRMRELEKMLAENTAATKRVEGNTEELVEIAKAFKGAGKVLAWLGSAIKWVAGISAAAAAGWIAWRAK